VLLGNSFGCEVIVALAVAAPERVSGLVLLGPTVDPRWRTFLRQVPRWLLEATREPWSILPILALDYLRCGTRRFFATARFALAYRMEDDLPSVHAPTLFVSGERDAFVSPAWAERVTNLLSNGELATLAGAVHAANYSAPEELARVVRAFLARLRPTNGAD
jgi:pimeloyl-ACP methyl ester carboxylesterase